MNITCESFIIKSIFNSRTKIGSIRNSIIVKCVVCSMLEGQNSNHKLTFGARVLI